MPSKFGVAPPAGGVQPQKKSLPNRMPMEVGKAVKVKKLTPQEEKALLEIGWNRGDPIPSNLATLLDEARAISSEATDVENLPPPVPMDTKPFVYDASKEQDVNDLPPDQKAKYNKMVKDILQQAKDSEEQEKALADVSPADAGDGVNATIRKALMPGSDIEIEDDTDDLPEDGNKADEAPQEKIPGKTHCPHCDWPLSQTDVVVITDEDRDMFVRAAASLQPYAKTFERLGGALKITIRELSVEDRETIFTQIRHDHDLKRIVSMDDARDLHRHYNIVLQVAEIATAEKKITRPADLTTWKAELEKADLEGLEEGDTLVRRAYLYVRKIDKLPESMLRQLAATVIEFDMLQNKLEAQSHEPDFWKPRTES